MCDKGESTLIDVGKFDELYMKLWKAKGRNHQLAVAIEELSELQKELTKLLRGRKDLSNVEEEWADVFIVLGQLLNCLLLDTDAINMHIEHKIKRIEVKEL